MKFIVCKKIVLCCTDAVWCSLGWQHSVGRRGIMSHGQEMAPWRNNSIPIKKYTTYGVIYTSCTLPVIEMVTDSIPHFPRPFQILVVISIWLFLPLPIAVAAVSSTLLGRFVCIDGAFSNRKWTSSSSNSLSMFLFNAACLEWIGVSKICARNLLLLRRRSSSRRYEKYHVKKTKFQTCAKNTLKNS